MKRAIAVVIMMAAVAAGAEERLIDGVEYVGKVAVLHQPTLKLRNAGDRLVFIKPIIAVDVARYIE